MRHRRGLNNNINNTHKRTLRYTIHFLSRQKNNTLYTIYQDKKSNLQDLLQKDKSMSIHIKNIQYLATEICKAKNSLSPEIMKAVVIFKENENYNLRGWCTSNE